jgi:hypothetical protein
MGIRSFAYLTDRYIIVATHVSPPNELQPNLLVFDLTTGPFSRGELETSLYICSFLCPSPGPWTVALDIGIQSDPPPSYMPDLDLSVPFFTDRQNRLFVVTIKLTNGFFIETFVIFIPSSTLTEYIATLSCHERRRCVPWEAWGPKGTRMMPSPGHSSVWVCYVYGMRFVASHGGRGTGTTIHVYDFNPLSIKRAVAAGRESNENTTYITTTTSLDTSGKFEDVVTTSLPFRVSRLSVETTAAVDGGNFGAVMCSEDNLIIVGVRGFKSAFFLRLVCLSPLVLLDGFWQ